MNLKITITLILLSIGTMSFAAPHNLDTTENSTLKNQWIKALDDKSIAQNSSELKSVGVLFTIDENNKVKIINLLGVNKATYQIVKQQLNGLENTSELLPNEIYRINITFQLV